jgi:ABC-type Fe3+/spermidine/putrescine transport system ATPase subunit
MDEPLGALDKKLREHMQLELKQIQEKVGITILYVTHDQEEALSMSTKIAVINEGQIEHMGTAIDIYDHPANQFVADFIGETNIFEAKIFSVDDDGIQVVGPCIQRIRANTLKQFEVGQNVHLAVRPEKILFIEKDEPDHCFYDAVVEDIIYLGDITRYYVRLSDVPQDEQEGLVVIKVQNRLGGMRHQRGDHVKIGWNEMDATIV